MTRYIVIGEPMSNNKPRLKIFRCSVLTVILLLIYLLLVPHYATAEKPTYDSAQVVIEGTVLGQSSADNKQKYTVTLIISTFAANSAIAPSTKYVLKTNEQNYFRIAIPSPSDRFYMHISFGPDGDTFIDNIYILEKGDNIRCELSKGNFVFFGKGSARLNCQSQIYQTRYKSNISQKSYEEKSKWLEIAVKNNRDLDSTLFRRMEIVQKYAPALGDTLANILRANCLGLRYFSSFRAERVTIKVPGKFDAFMENLKRKNLVDLKNLTLDTNSMIQSPNYTDFLFESLLLENLSQTNAKDQSAGSKYAWIFQKIRDSYMGKVREKLMVTFFLNFARNAIALSYLKEAEPLINDNRYKKILMDIGRSNVAGNDFLPFQMSDDKDKVVSLEDFSDKIVLVDFWFTGCGPCRTLNKAMKPVFEEFRDNPLVKFVSVSIDQDRSQWLKSVASNEYTHQGAINLYAGGKDASSSDIHPLIKFYNISTFPTLILLKNKKIFDPNPPKPLSDDEGNPQNGHTKKLIELITRALQNN